MLNALDHTVDTGSPGQEREVQQLLTSYTDIFGSSETDVGSTNLMQHTILTDPGTMPIQQPSCRLGPEMDHKVDEPVQSLVQQSLVEPGGGGEWSFLVLLVRREDVCVPYSGSMTVRVYYRAVCTSALWI